MAFFSKEFKEQLTTSRYWKVKDMPQGDSRFRIVQAPIYGWIDWKDQKPYRYRANKKPKESFDEENPIRPFVCCYVWDYARKGLFAIEFTQKSIIMALESLADSEDWGDLTRYDLKLTKEGSGQKVKYTLNPTPHKAMNAEIQEAMRLFPANLNALFEGGDPWKHASNALGSTIDDPDWEVDPQPEKIDSRPNKGHSSAIQSMSSVDRLKEVLELDGISTDYLDEWIKLRADGKNESAETVAESCLLDDVLPKFKKSFISFHAKKFQEEAVPF